MRMGSCVVEWGGSLGPGDRFERDAECEMCIVCSEAVGWVVRGLLCVGVVGFVEHSWCTWREPGQWGH